MKKRVLVTGGMGYIGSHTVVELVRAGYEVIIADNLSNSKEFILERIEWIAGSRPQFYKTDLADKDSLQKVFETEAGFDIAIHFAALKAVGESMQQPLRYYNNNIVGMLNLLQCMSDHETRNLVFSSSATVYGYPAALPLKETSPCGKSLSPYGSTKQMGEEILDKSSGAGLIKSISLRYFNPVGAHVSGLLGELPLGKPNNLMPFITQAAIGKQNELVIYGNDYNTPDGTCIRDYIHVVDLAIAHVAACKRLLENNCETPHEIFNIGTGLGYSVMDLIRTFEEVNEIKVPYRFGPRRPGDAPILYADVTKATTVLEWKAQKTLGDMVKDAWRWELSLKEQETINHSNT
jgi:UDP-glucose 4-epimerase